MFSSITDKIKANPVLKKRVLFLAMHPVKTRPRCWLRCFRFLYMKKGKKSVIYRSVRKDIVPFNTFVMGNYSVIEDYAVINNAVGDILIGNHTRIGVGDTIIGPVTIGNKVNLAQNVVISGLNHNFEDIEKAIAEQGVSTSNTVISSNVWIGANSVVLPGVHVGKHVVVGAGSVVSRDIPDYCVAVGNPARVIKQYDVEKQTWVKVHKE
ncbi:acyltransferase [Petrimonas mucosa]|jgi:acetyltransferase-like isoleucine patch superfamily enzyme|uniref:Putative acetyl transferase n=1 Tax=Petrimonas mucosa TaxID=1642646 RepID=A0A1G4GAI1_9BACT|nr:DapH/DapD/GlmU-related protein [Petrimonas mucosa]SCM59560.1 putative acetyl transferase {ECO:0000313/EMBL:BAD49413,1} [Petrimonas mucosa]